MSDLAINKEATQMLRTFGENNVPMISFCEPLVTNIDNSTCTVVIPYGANTKNHLNCLYFGALHVGSDCAGGLLAMHHIQTSGKPLSLIFKSTTAQFLKRAEGDTHFTCNDGLAIQQAISKVAETGERVQVPLNISATVPTKLGNEPVATFELTLSIK